MAIRHLIGPRPSSASEEVSVSRLRVCAVPYDLLQEGSRRLGIMSLVGAALWTLGPVLYHLATPDLSSGLRFTDAIAAVCALISLTLFAYTRREAKNPQFVLDLGLGYMVCMALGLGVMEHWYPMQHGMTMLPMISWIGAVVLMFSAIVPATPAKMLIAGFVAVSMNPIGMYIAKARGAWEFGPGDVLAMHFSDYLLLGVAVVISHVVTRIGGQVTKAREMGSYKLVKMLGKGGMGEVWQASHRMLTRDAAIKLIQPDLLNRVSQKDAKMMQRRFEQEAKATASLRSPNTVELYDYGVTEDGVFYYVMELLDGIDLATLVKTFGPQPPGRVIHILSQVCKSLGDAHRHGLIHRDIKPTNIYLCRMGIEYDFAKVLDFGLVKVLDTKDAQMTGVGAATGTPAYMAPEVALGDEHIDGRCDLYGLGCVAYWLLTGKLVFEESSATAMMLAHLQKAPVPPSERSGLPVPAALEQAVMMCLAKKPEERPESAERLARALAGAEGSGAWTQDDAERWWSANVPEAGVRSEQEADGSTLTQGLSYVNNVTAP
jgi:tRNA A-37 threonylcarbamoyl transferase component Bud32